MSDNSPITLSIPRVGMKMLHPSLLKPENYSLLLNGNLQSVGDSFALITNELSNILCSRFKQGYKVINVQPVLSLNLTFFFLVHPDSNKSEIGIIYNAYNKDRADKEVFCKDCPIGLKEDVPLEEQEQTETCTYTTFVSADCLNFNINFPVKSWVKVDDCNIRLYFTEDLNSIRYIDYSDYQKETLVSCPRVYSDELDCDKIKVFKDACYPKISYADIVSGGQNNGGTAYQFSVAYSDVNSNPLTQYFYTTNPIPLGDNPIVAPSDPTYPVAKSIKLHIEGLNTDFNYFNIVVLKTVNGNTTSYLAGTFANSNTTFDYVYSGIDKNLLKDISVDELLKRTPKYTKAKGIAESNGFLFFYDLEEPRTLNLQPVINNLTLKWQTVVLNEGDYKNPIIAANYKSYLRDESYPFAIEFTRTNSPATPRFHIPGRESTPYDLEDVSELTNLTKNPDVFNASLCGTTPSGNLRWEVYNTATEEGTRVCVDANAPNPVLITDTQECIGDQFWMATVASNNATPVASLITLPAPVFYNPSGTVTSVSTNANDNGNLSCDCSEFAVSYPPSAVIISSPLVLDQNADDTSIQINKPEKVVYNNIYVNGAGDYNKANIPKPVRFPSSASPNPCKDSEWEDWYDEQNNRTSDSATGVYQNTTNTCDANLKTYGSFVYKDADRPCTDYWYSFTSTNDDGVLGILFSYVLSVSPTIDFYEADGTTPITTNGVVVNSYSDANGEGFLLENLVLGRTYTIKIHGCTEHGIFTTCKEATFSLCLITPKPIATTITVIPAEIQLITQCQIQYYGQPENNCVAQPYKYGEFSYNESI